MALLLISSVDPGRLPRSFRRLGCSVAQRRRAKSRDRGGQDLGIFEAADHGPGGAMLRYGKPAPDFTLPDTEDRPVRLGDHRGKDVVLVFYCYDWGSI
jgi:AhpC/TSA family